MKFSWCARRASTAVLFAFLVILIAIFTTGCGSSATLGAGGSITTVAGDGTIGYTGDSALATSAELNFPHHVVADSAGNFYIADTGNNRIRRVAASTGDISTYAGNGTAGYLGDSGAAISAELNNPIGLAIDSSGNLYIADYGNNVIRMVANASGVITSVAGTGTLGYSGDSGPATAATLRAPQGVAVDASGNIFIADTGNHVIREVASATAVITTVAGTGSAGSGGDGGPATSAALDFPTDVVVDSSGNLYIADTANQLVRKVASGTISTVAGTLGKAGYAGDGGAATSATLNGPRGLALDSSGNLYIADYGNNVVRVVSSTNISTAAGDGAAGYAGDKGSATKAEMVTPYGVFADSSGSLFIADSGNNVIRKVTK